MPGPCRQVGQTGGCGAFRLFGEVVPLMAGKAVPR
jgi:hypothetical protein